MARKKPTVTDIRALKHTNYKVTALTAQNYFQAKCADEAGIDAIVVNDVSLSCLNLGRSNGFETTVSEMIEATKAVKRGAGECFVITSMPFGSFADKDGGLNNAIKIYKESGCDALHVEGGKAKVISAITKSGIPVLGHIGVTKVNIGQTGKTQLKAKTVKEVKELLKEARELEEAGCFGIVLECIPSEAAKYITDKLNIVTIGIGAGVHCNGQFLVSDDMLGCTPDFKAKFVKRYADLPNYITEAYRKFCEEVQDEEFPSEHNSYKMSEAEQGKLKSEYKNNRRKFA